MYGDGVCMKVVCIYGMCMNGVYACMLLTVCIYVYVCIYVCMYDRYVYQRAISQQKYGTLLKQWEKREAAGEKLLQEAALLLSSLPARSSSSSSIDAYENDSSSDKKNPNPSIENDSSSPPSQGTKLLFLTSFFQILN